MVQFLEVAPEEVPNFRESHRGRVSYPILKGFLETNMKLAKLDRTGLQQSHQSLYSSLTAYIRNHNLPVKLFSRGGDIYLMRLDLDENGEFVEDWDKKANKEQEALEATTAAPISAEEVAARFEEEKGQTTK